MKRIIIFLLLILSAVSTINAQPVGCDPGNCGSGPCLVFAIGDGTLTSASCNDAVGFDLSNLNSQNRYEIRLRCNSSPTSCGSYQNVSVEFIPPYTTQSYIVKRFDVNNLCPVNTPSVSNSSYIPYIVERDSLGTQTGMYDVLGACGNLTFTPPPFATSTPIPTQAPGNCECSTVSSLNLACVYPPQIIKDCTPPFIALCETIDSGMVPPVFECTCRCITPTPSSGCDSYCKSINSTNSGFCSVPSPSGQSGCNDNGPSTCGGAASGPHCWCCSGAPVPTTPFTVIGNCAGSCKSLGSAYIYEYCSGDPNPPNLLNCDSNSVDCNGGANDCVCCTQPLGSSAINRQSLSVQGNCPNISDIDTAIGCLPVGDKNAFLAFILRWALGISGGTSFILIIYSGFTIMTAGGDKRKLQAGKELLTAAISGLILIIFSVFILDFIGIRILKIPGL